MKKNPKAEKSGNDEAPGDIVDLFGWLEMMQDDLGLLSEVIKNRA